MGHGGGDPPLFPSLAAAVRKDAAGVPFLPLFSFFSLCCCAR